MAILGFQGMHPLFPYTTLSIMNTSVTKETTRTRTKLKSALIFKFKNCQLKAKGMFEQSELQNPTLSSLKT